MKKHIEKAWEKYRLLAVPNDASETQVNETRQAFFAGASVLFNAILMHMSDDSEPTDRDMKLMTDINNEIASFGQEIDQKILGDINKH